MASIMKLIKIIIYLLKKALITSLDIKKINIPTKYSNFANVYLSNFVVKLLYHTSINNYLINLVDNK